MEAGDAQLSGRPWLKFLLVPAVIMALLAICPQAGLWLTRDGLTHGSYFVSNYDEVAYSAYVNALVEGKPRLTDPFVASEPSSHESLYSIQFIPAYSIAIPTRLLGLSTSSVFILLSVLFAIASSAALFWFIYTVTGQRSIAGAGVLVVLCLGTAAAYQGELRYLIEGRVLIDFLPFLRRYQPGFAFPVFFVFCGLTWHSFINKDARSRLYLGLASGCLLAFLVFSYFYLWTAAAAWLVCLVITFLIGRTEDRWRVIAPSAVIAAIAIAALVPYFAMLLNRSVNVDSTQLLTLTHMPSLASPSMVLGVVIFIGACLLAYFGRLNWRDPVVLLCISFLLTPVVLHNQQILTGRSLQPVHYEIFIGNYMVLTGAVLLAAALLSSAVETSTAKFGKVVVYAAGLAVVWGFFEVAGPTSRNMLYAVMRDESVAAVDRIKQDLGTEGHTPTVLATNFITTDFIPSISTFRPLWNPHTSSAGGVSVDENKRLFYLYLFYSGFTPNDLKEALKANSFEVTSAIFGAERALPQLGGGAPIKPAEIQSEVQKFGDFVRAFDPKQASDPPLSYLIVPAKAVPDLSNLDRWYQRDQGEVTGMFTVFRLQPKF